MRSWGVAGLALVVLLSGCASLSPTSEETTDSGSPTAADHQGPTSTQKETPQPGRPPTSPPAATGTPPAASDPPQGAEATIRWPPLAQATVRPGVTTSAAGSQCTSNFLFRSPDDTLYLGVAAHCVDGLALGDPVQITGANRPGRLAYSSWIALELACESSAAGTGCTGGEFRNDFALIQIDEADRERTHPAVLHYGGPTRLRDANELQVMDRVLSWGDSGLRAGLDPLSPHEGYVTAEQDGPQFYVYTAPQGIPGDSGSGVMTADGEAVGVLVTISTVLPGENGVVGLSDALELMTEKTGLVVELCTWEQLDDGRLPG